jgi:Fe2+ or Zn2+ uptake regulation protein
MQEKVLGLFIHFGCGAAAETIYRAARDELGIPQQDVYTTLKELALLELLKTENMSDELTWSITLEGLKAIGITNGNPWP